MGSLLLVLLINYRYPINLQYSKIQIKSFLVNFPENFNLSEELTAQIKTILSCLFLVALSDYFTNFVKLKHFLNYLVFITV